MRFTRLLDDGQYLEALRIAEQWNQVQADVYGRLHPFTVNQVIMYALAMARTWKVRPPLPTATDEQARTIMTSFEKYSDVYVRPDY